MTARQTIRGPDDRARRQRISHEVQQLRLMSESLRTTAMRSFMKRLAGEGPDVERRKTTVKPTSVAA